MMVLMMNDDASVLIFFFNPLKAFTNSSINMRIHSFSDLGGGWATRSPDSDRRSEGLYGLTQ